MHTYTVTLRCEHDDFTFPWEVVASNRAQAIRKARSEAMISLAHCPGPHTVVSAKQAKKGAN